MVKLKWKTLVALSPILLMPALLQAQTSAPRPDSGQSAIDQSSTRQDTTGQSPTGRQDAGSAPATRSDTKQAKQGGAKKLSTADRRFLTEAAQSGLAEMESGRVATQKAIDPAVKQFAQRMADDHSKANEELKRLAADKGVALPAGLNLNEKAAIKRLQQAAGDQFDETYIKDQIVAHQKAVALFQGYAKRGSDPDLKAFAQKNLPTLQEHLSLALAANAPQTGAGGTTGKREDKSGPSKPAGPTPGTTQRP